MRCLATFLFFCITCLSYSQEVRYDSLQNINKSNYTQLVGQTLYAPRGELVVRNLFWSNKSGKIYKPHPDWILYPKYSIPDDVLNKHYLIEKIITKSTPLLKTRMKETDEVVYININALLNYTTSPVMFVDGYIQKCKQLFLNRHLYMDKSKYKKSLPASYNTKAPNLASFYCNNLRVTTTTNHNYGGLMLLSDRTTSSTPTEIEVSDYLRARVNKQVADEMIRQREIELEMIARAEAERKRIQDSIAVAKMQKQQQEDSLALVRMKEKYMHKTWYYSLREWQYIRFEPIAVIDIQVHRDSTGNVSFPMKLKYKNTGEVVSHNAVIFSDGKCTFDMCFHNIPPEKEYPTVKHWKAIKDLKLVLGMNKQEVQLVWGIPADINTSKGSWGVHEQWVYPSLFGGRSRYLYFKNGRLSAIQE